MVHRRIVPGLLCAVVLTLSACNPVFGQSSGPVRHAPITGEPEATYSFEQDGAAIRAMASPTDSVGGTREFFWDTASPYIEDQQACITWENPTGSLGGDQAQPGLAMRIAPTGPDNTGVRGITVNENIWTAAVWYLWVNTWDSTNVAQPYQGVELFDLSDIVGKFWFDDDGMLHSTLVPGPWHICARALGLDFTFKVWTGDDPEPPWDDPDHVFTTVLPEGWDHAGYSGGYIGHLVEGQSVHFSGFSAMPLCVIPEMVDTPRCQEQLAQRR